MIDTCIWPLELRLGVSMSWLLYPKYFGSLCVYEWIIEHFNHLSEEHDRYIQLQQTLIFRCFPFFIHLCFASFSFSNHPVILQKTSTGNPSIHRFQGARQVSHGSWQDLGPGTLKKWGVFPRPKGEPQGRKPQQNEIFQSKVTLRLLFAYVHPFFYTGCTLYNVYFKHHLSIIHILYHTYCETPLYKHSLTLTVRPWK